MVSGVEHIKSFITSRSGCPCADVSENTESFGSHVELSGVAPLCCSALTGETMHPGNS